MTLTGTKNSCQSIPLPGYWNFKPCWNLNHLHVSAAASPLPASKRLGPFTQPCSWVQRFPRLGPRRQNPWFTWNGTAAKFDKVWLGVKDMCESVAATWFRMVSQHAPMACGDNNLWNHIWFQTSQDMWLQTLEANKMAEGELQKFKGL